MKIRVGLLSIFLLFILFSLLILSITNGTIKIEPKNFYNYVLEGTTGNPIYDKIIEKCRIPRTVGAVFAGMGLAVAGLLMQSLFRNPLADPYLIGVSGGASLGVALYVFTSLLFKFGIPHSIWGFIISAYLGSLLSMFVVLSLAKKVKQITTLLIVGLMIGYISSGLITIVIAFSDFVGVNNDVLASFMMWGYGSLSSLTMKQSLIMGVLVVICCFITYSLSKFLDAYLLGENYAKSVGIDIKKLRILIILISCMITATIVAFAGPIGFIGLVCPITARLLCGTSKHIYVIPNAMLIGAIFLIVADILVRPGIVIPTTSSELPLMCPLAIIGSPIAIIIYIKRKIMGI
ncbi:FecCD family ABC transporter permease [Methanotorris igneus]|uniref:ABC-type transporter, integral membrane subunit n=1 Tax=Methanotorris igneus (strain DSM 5666 / JCM 11834 / Kol 5) TaxID=880724 RepID=F6BC24_METIK|nr:iron ABC transporter permease [Methanotorris igneus]AEF96105.1 ABC-type transporter, integral membrane subunit [Methanotorris igneus Kol 5]